MIACDTPPGHRADDRLPPSSFATCPGESTYQIVARGQQGISDKRAIPFSPFALPASPAGDERGTDTKRERREPPLNASRPWPPPTCTWGGQEPEQMPRGAQRPPPGAVSAIGMTGMDARRPDCTAPTCTKDGKRCRRQPEGPNV